MHTHCVFVCYRDFPYRHNDFYILYKLYILSPYTNPISRKLSAFLRFQKTSLDDLYDSSLSMIYNPFSSWGFWILLCVWSP